MSKIEEIRNNENCNPDESGNDPFILRIKARNTIIKKLLAEIDSSISSDNKPEALDCMNESTIEMEDMIEKKLK